MSGLKGLTGVNALSLKYEEITKPERFVNFHAAMKCICQPLWAFLQTNMTAFPTV